MVPRNDHLWIGLAVSLVVSGLAFFLLLQLGGLFSSTEGRAITFRPRTLALIAICINILPMNVFRRTYRTRALKGLVIGVMVLSAVWFFYFGQELLNG